MVRPSIYRDLASLGVASVYEAAGAIGLVAGALMQIVPATRAAGPARIALCGPGDNRAVHEVMARTQPGDVLVLALEKVEPVALLGELLATQAKAHGVAGVLVEGAVRDVDELRQLGLPVWARYVHATAATKVHRGAIDVPVNVGGVAIAPGDAVVLDADGAVVVPMERLERVANAAADRRNRELRMRESFLVGELSYDLSGMRAEDEAGPVAPEP